MCGWQQRCHRFNPLAHPSTVASSSICDPGDADGTLTENEMTKGHATRLAKGGLAVMGQMPIHRLSIYINEFPPSGQVLLHTVFSPIATRSSFVRWSARDDATTWEDVQNIRVHNMKILLVCAHVHHRSRNPAKSG